MGIVTQISDYRRRHQSAAMSGGLRAVAGMNDQKQSTMQRYKENPEAMLYCMRGTLRAFREQQKKVSADPSVENMAYLQELSDALDDILDAE